MVGKEVSFEKALSKLEKIVDDLEQGDLNLDISLKKFEEGTKLANICRGELDNARKKIELLTKNKKGEFCKKDFQEDLVE
jgi:exodeoxyribonuclease VII small subunit